LKFLGTWSETIDRGTAFLHIPLNTAPPSSPAKRSVMDRTEGFGRVKSALIVKNLIPGSVWLWT
jgi:hypothetical protein